MANTVTLLSYANTFGDWVVTTNKLAQENNDLAANNFVKPSGTLFLNAPVLGLQVANNAVVQGQFQVSGVGSSAYIQKNLQVDGSIVSTGNNYFIGNDNNPVLAMTQLGTGLVLRVNAYSDASGNATVIDANGNVYIGSIITGPNRLNVANGNVNFANNLTVGQNTTSQIVRVSNHVVSKDLTASANILGDRVQANTNLISPTLAVSGTAYVYYVQANNRVNTETLTVTSSAIVDNLRSNNYVWSPTVVGASSVISNNITANISFSTATLNVSSAINAATADLYVDDIVANTASIQGNFIINGDIVYNTDVLTINADAAAPQNGIFASARGLGNANAHIRWNESQDYWDIRDVNNPSSYSKILTANLISNSLLSTSSDNLASSSAANALNTLTRAAFEKANNASETRGTSNNASYFFVGVDSNNSTATAETLYTSANVSFNPSTSTLNVANIASGALRFFDGTVQSTSASGLVEAAFGKANAEGTINSTQNTWITNTNTFAGSAFNSANAGVNLATSAYGKANAESTINSTQNTWITNTNTKMEAAFAKANTGATITNDTSTNATRYPLFTSLTAGALTTVNTNSTGLTYNPSTGILSSTEFSATSDINKKENVETITNALTTVQQLRGVTYNWKENGKKSMGLIAQEVELILPELVNETENGKAVSYPNMIGLLVEAIKELRVEIDRLKGDSK